MFDFIKGDKEDDRKVKKVSKIKEKNGEKKEKVEDNINLKSVVNQMISNKKRLKAKHKAMEDEEKMYVTINENKGKYTVKKVLIKEDEISEEDAKKLIGKNEKLDKEAKYEIVEEIPEEEIKKYFDEMEMKLCLILLKEIKKMIEKLKKFLRLKKKMEKKN